MEDKELCDFIGLTFKNISISIFVVFRILILAMQGLFVAYSYAAILLAELSDLGSLEGPSLAGKINHIFCIQFIFDR